METYSSLLKRTIGEEDQSANRRQVQALEAIERIKRTESSEIGEMLAAMDQCLGKSCILCGEFSIQMVDDCGLANTNWNF